MKKILALSFVMLLICGVAFAAVAVDNGTQTYFSDSTTLNFSSDGFTVTSDGSTATITYGAGLLATGRKGGASTMSSSSTYLGSGGIAYSYVEKRVGGGGGLDGQGIGTSLPNGTAGQIITFVITALQTSGTWVVTPVTSSAFTSLTFTAVGSTATLLYVNSTVGWVVLSSTTVTIARNQLP